MPRYGETMLVALSTVGLAQVACSSRLAIFINLLGLQAMYLSLFEFDVLAWFYFLALATVVTHYMFGQLYNSNSLATLIHLCLWKCHLCQACAPFLIFPIFSQFFL